MGIMKKIIKLYQDSQCIIKFALKNRKEQMIRKLDEHHVKNMSNEYEDIEDEHYYVN